MTQNWHTIWSKRSTPDGDAIGLPDLLAADGFDILGHVNENAWLDYVGSIASRLGIKPGDSVFDVGCGAGAFLYPFAQNGHPVGGMDFSNTLIDTARRAMPAGQFLVDEAAKLENKPQYDWVCANGVFLYFPHADYARTVLARMAAKARYGMAILDVPDAASRGEALVARRAAYTGKDYEADYQGLDHLFLPRHWWADEAKALELQEEVCDQFLSGYLHTPFRYNVFLRRA